MKLKSKLIALTLPLQIFISVAQAQESIQVVVMGFSAKQA